MSRFVCGELFPFFFTGSFLQADLILCSLSTSLSYQNSAQIQKHNVLPRALKEDGLYKASLVEIFDVKQGTEGEGGVTTEALV